MNSQELDLLLRRENDVEKEQKISKKNLVDPDLRERLEYNYGETPSVLFSLPEQLFFSQGNVYIRKHNRYAPMPLHQHEFLELNYMYSGTCTQYINEETVVLSEGDLIVLDKGSSHSLAALGENDILVNLLVRFESINTQVLQKMTNQLSILATFLAKAGEGNKDYLRFKGTDQIRDLMSLILREYFDENKLSNHLLELYLPILFTELSRSQLDEIKAEESLDPVSTCVKIIEEEYRTIDLETLGRKMGFNGHYLSNLIKSKTGKTFKQLVQQQRMQTAYQLVLHTNYTVEDISERVGLQDASYFYQSFKRYFSKTPNQIRKEKGKGDL